MNVGLEEICRLAFDGLRITSSKKVNAVFRLQNLLSDDQFLTLVFPYFRFKTLDGEFRATASILCELCKAKTFFPAG